VNPARTLLLLFLFVYGPVFSATNFVNFETAPVHPIALSPDARLLAACNLPDAHVELYDLQTDSMSHKISLPVGLDPVTVRFRNDNELWVVNALSDSINIIDVRNFSVIRVISTRTRPADLVFAGKPLRAFVSCPPDNIVQVFDPDSGALVRTIDIPGERPKALAVSPDGTMVFVAIFESGNGTTIIAPKFTDLGHTPAAGPVDLPIGPYGGLNPPPNQGTNLYPALGTNLPASSEPPPVSLIVKKQNDGRWLDDNNGDWTEMISGTNAPFTGRVPGWDLIDHDVVVIDANSFELSVADHLMNICMDLAVNPVTGLLAVVGTDGINHIRYEPVLKSIFIRDVLALVEANAEAQIRDLNPHLDYKNTHLTPAERQQSLGDPRGVVWNDGGTRLYVSGMGSDNVAMFDASGKRLAVSKPLAEGPTGLAFDGSRNHLYVLSRFGAAVTALDADTLIAIETVRYFDPTPEVVRKGRRHFYNTHETSGLGQAACASCHVDGRFDRLAWDLGTPIGEMNVIATNTYNFVSALPGVTNNFHPMKGPMVTQTLQDIIGHEPFHWRGDRIGLEEFNPTFTNLQGADAELTPAEMQEFEDFLATIRFPPNRLRNFDNSLSPRVPLTNHTSLGRGRRFKGDPLPNGNAITGLSLFNASALICTECHTMPTGNGPDRFFKNGRWTAIAVGPNGEHHLGIAALPRADLHPFKVAQLRSLPDKVGFDLNAVSRSGFGFLHDGRVDSLTRFVQDGFAVTDDQQTADLIAFLLSFSGSDLPTSTNSLSQNIAPGTVASLDAPAATGRQAFVISDTFGITQFVTRANSSTGRVELVVRTVLDGKPRGWLYNRISRQFKSDTQEPALPLNELIAKLNGTPVVFTLVPAGTGERFAIDRDGDGALNYDEILAGSDPADPASRPGDARILTVRLEPGIFRFTWASPENRKYNLLSKTKVADAWQVLDTGTTTASVTTNSAPLGTAAQSWFTVEVLPP
jgi:YVTN family beta-propeller protein